MYTTAEQRVPQLVAVHGAVERVLQLLLVRQVDASSHAAREVDQCVLRPAALQRLVRTVQSVTSHIASQLSTHTVLISEM